MNARAIAEILAPIFAEQDWRWMDFFTVSSVPDVDQIEAEIERLVSKLQQSSERSIAAGRLMAYRIDPEFDPNWIKVGLEFSYDC